MDWNWKEKVALMMEAGEEDEERAIHRLRKRQKKEVNWGIIEEMWDRIDKLTNFRAESARLLQKYAPVVEAAPGKGNVTYDRT